MSAKKVELSGEMLFCFLKEGGKSIFIKVKCYTYS